MKPAKDLPIVMEKSAEYIEDIIELVMASILPEPIKVFVIGCINLDTRLPKRLMEHRITVTNLNRLIIGKGDKNQKSNHQSKSSNESSKTEKNQSSDKTPNKSNDKN